MFCSVQQPYLLILANLQSNKRHKKETPQFPIDFSPTCIWQAVNQIDWYLRRILTKDVIICVQTLRVIC